MFGRKKKYDFYLAGGMRGYPDLNKPMFTLVARLLREKGFTVWNPSEHESYLELSFAKCMILDLNAVINKCCRIVLLPDWRKSLGANAETFSVFVCGKEAVEVVLNEDRTDFNFIPVVLNHYRLPYQGGEIHQFDPHHP